MSAQPPGRIIWIAFALVPAAAYGFILRPLQARIEHVSEQTFRIEERTDREVNALQRLASLRSVGESLHRELRRVSLPATAGGAAANVLAQLAALAAEHHVDIASVEPQAAAPPASGNRPDAQRFEAMEIRVRGAYPDVIQFIRSASLTTSPARVGTVSLERSRTDRGILDASIRLDALRDPGGADGA